MRFEVQSFAYAKNWLMSWHNNKELLSGVDALS